MCYIDIKSLGKNMSGEIPNKIPSAIRGAVFSPDSQTNSIPRGLNLTKFVFDNFVKGLDYVGEKKLTSENFKNQIIPLLKQVADQLDPLRNTPGGEVADKWYWNITNLISSLEKSDNPESLREMMNTNFSILWTDQGGKSPTSTDIVASLKKNNDLFLENLKIQEGWRVILKDDSTEDPAKAKLERRIIDLKRVVVENILEVVKEYKDGQRDLTSLYQYVNILLNKIAMYEIFKVQAPIFRAACQKGDMRQLEENLTEAYSELKIEPSGKVKKLADIAKELKEDDFTQFLKDMTIDDKGKLDFK